MWLIDKLIAFFNLFKGSDLANNDLVQLFWLKEDTEAAIAYIQAYKTEIEKLQQKYEDQEVDTETSYEQYLQDRQKIS